MARLFANNTKIRQVSNTSNLSYLSRRNPFTFETFFLYLKTSFYGSSTPHTNLPALSQASDSHVDFPSQRTSPTNVELALAFDDLSLKSVRTSFLMTTGNSVRNVRFLRRLIDCTIVDPPLLGFEWSKAYDGNASHVRYWQLTSDRSTLPLANNDLALRLS